MKWQLRELLHGVIDRIDFSEKISIDDGKMVDLIASGAFTLEGKNVFLRFRGEGEIDTPCDRCLKPVNYRHIFYYEDMIEENDFDEFDLHELIRQEYIISKPLQTLCSESCQGLCPECGVNRNEVECTCEEERIDPRLSDLKDFLDE